MPDNNKLNLLLYWAILITFCTFDIEINAAIYTSKETLEIPSTIPLWLIAAILAEGAIILILSAFQLPS